MFQFVVVSLKDGMFNNANVLFRTKFVDGMSTVTRSVQHHSREDDVDARRGEKFHKPGMRNAAEGGDDWMEMGEETQMNGNDVGTKKRAGHNRVVSANGRGKKQNGMYNGAMENGLGSDSDSEPTVNGVNGHDNNFSRQNKKVKHT